MTARPRLTDLQRAARIAREEGVVVVVVSDGTEYKFHPPEDRPPPEPPSTLDLVDFRR